MTPQEKQQLVKHWMLLAKTVFVAEDNIKDEWKPKLQAVKGKSDPEIQQTADDYLRAIAEEIIKHTKMEELQ
jgi:hypothetical protein